ncbi:phage protease [Breoghania corrubedonensis]|nr:phage protease [Breoghania corrubedonensis]
MLTEPANTCQACHSTVLDRSAADAVSGGKWVKLIPAGVFSGRDGRGPYVAGDAASMRAIIDATLQRAGDTEIMVDYDHQSVFASVPGVGGIAPAAGWIKEFQVRADGIWGRVEWTAAAAQRIRAGEYRYLSPVYHHSKTTGQLGPIVCVALTNTPNLDLAGAVAARAQLSPSEHNPVNGDPMKTIAKALGLPEDASEADILAKLNPAVAAQTALATIAKACGLDEAAKPDDVVTAAQSVTTSLAAVAKAVGAKADANANELVTAVQKAGSPDPAKFIPADQVAAMMAEFKQLKDGIDSDKAETAVNSAIADGKLAPALKDWGLALHRTDPKQFATYVGAAPKLTGAQLGDRKKDAAEPTLDDADQAVMRAMGISAEDYLAAKKKDAAE